MILSLVWCLNTTFWETTGSLEFRTRKQVDVDDKATYVLEDESKAGITF